MAFRRRNEVQQLTPEEREARIAELRARRRARLRWLALRSGLVAGLLVLAGAVLLYWLLNTIGGRDALLKQIVARLPDGATLAWRSAEGPAAGPLTLRGVRFAYTPACPPEEPKCTPGGPVVFTADTVMLDPAIRPLLGRRLRLDALRVNGATLDLPEDNQPFELPRWPDVLPDIQPPLALQADDVRIDGLRVTRAGAPLVNITHLRGGIDAQPGRLHMERLAVDSDRGRFTLHGDYVPHDDYRADLTATAVFPAPTGRTAPRLGLVARGDLSRMDVAVAGRAPGALRASVTLRGREHPQWQLRSTVEAFDPALLMAGEPGVPLAWTLQADGVEGAADLRGQVTRDGQTVTVLPSKVRLNEQVLDVQPLALALLEGTATLRGRAELRDPDHGTLRFAVNARNLHWGGADGTPAIIANGDFGVAGALQAWAAIGTARLERDGQAADLRFDARGNTERATLKTLHARMPTGTLDARGDVAWTPSLQWVLNADLAGFDPGYFAPAWKGAVNGVLASRSHTRKDRGLEATLDVSRLGGQLRGRVLSGQGRFALHGAPPTGGEDRYESDVALRLGASQVQAKGALGRTLDVDATFAPLHLADLLPSGQGTLQGQLHLRGPRNAPDVDVDLEGHNLAHGDYRVDTLHARGRLPWRGRDGALDVRATGLQAGVPFTTLDLTARGAVEALQLDARAAGDLGMLRLTGNADKRGATWQGALASLAFDPSKGAQWRLQQPARFSWDGRNGALTHACLASSGGGTLCASADWPRRGLDVEGRGLPLALLQPYLPERSDRRPWLLRGDVALDAQVRPVGNAWRGTATLTSAGGGLKFNERARQELVRYGDLSLRTTFDPQRLTAELDATLNDDGQVDARITTGWDGYAPLVGEVAVNTDELTWMELFSPDIVEPTGRLVGRIQLSGTRAQPLLGGNAQLGNFATELPALAIQLREGDLRLDAQPDGTARITGRVRSGEGTLNIDGTLGWQGDDTPLVLNVRGDNVLVSDTRDLRAVASPDVVVRYAARQPLQVTGTVTIPSARMDLERLDEGVSASDDVVVLDPVDPEDTGTLPLDLDLTLSLGGDVQLNGFGLDGTLGGKLRVRARPGREMTASGQLDVDGRYTAYGQKLAITRGELVWSGGPVGNPILNIRAEREVGDVTAGVDIRGRASAPEATVWSNPASSQSEALAYLALGRPLSSASRDESRQLNAASAALTAGGSLLASQLGARIGLDDAGVMESRALGERVFGVGKYLSPRLYVSYGVSLLGTGQVLTLKYLLRRGFDIEIESSTLENRASVNWRTEK
ncbi:translocation/assembly module TamB domain-containing protein [Aerolutibacter ruishenii]|uniref:Autotransporter secretion inner membrane protein TamB n=1 Tax=Aerolutibacter ruishenii TaxID=686800 RepID=A0A562M0W9_9GAMM|nr:translocation/assembly module TamB domain-containing protein [Lysobacter ruishenii]TWI13594.1 autotransporter secretion inner membrane protein TamB [Lysobacter ruishenii]